MKEFEKKANPPRDSEGVKGLSKFLPMTESAYRRRLTEYEIQIQDLQAHARAMETEVVHLRKKLEEIPKDFVVLENKLREANRQLVQAFNQNEKLVNTLYEAREQISSLKEEVDKLCAPPSSYGVFLSLNEDGTVNILSSGRKVKVNLHPSIGKESIKPGQELVLNEGLNVIETAGYEIQGEVVIMKESPGRGARGRHGARGRGEGRGHRRAAPPGEAQGRRPPPHGLEVGLPPGEAAEERGRGPGPRRGAGHPVRGHRRPHDPDRGDPGRGGAPVPLRRLLPRAQARAAQGRPPLRAAGLRQDDDRQGGREQPGGEGLGEARGEDQGLLHEHQGPRAPQQVRGRDRAEDPRDLRQGQGEGRRGRARRRLLRRDGRALPHARLGDLLRRRDDDRAAAPGRDRRGRGAQERHRDRRLQPAGPDRSRHPSARAARREDQDRPAGPPGGGRHHGEVPHAGHPDARAGARAARRRHPGGHHAAHRDGGRRHVHASRTRTASSRSPTRTGTRRSCTSRTSPRAR